jgi:hypothetical protein
MNCLWIRKLQNLSAAFAALAFVLSSLTQAQAQPQIVSVNPTNGATGVASGAQVVFTFSTPMYSAATMALFTNANNGSLIYLLGSWSAGNTVLTYTPSPSWPANSTISWGVNGIDSLFNPLVGQTTGSFSTGSGGGGSTGTGTNKYTSFLVMKTYSYDQSSAAAPTPDATAPYFFSASTMLASNRTATNIALTVPTTPATLTNLQQNPVRLEQYYMFSVSNNAAGFESAFPQGNYVFNVQAVASNQSVTVALPVSMQQPNAPHLTNYAAAQAVNPAQPFTLGWDAFTGGTSTDFVYVAVSLGGTNVYETPSYLLATNALPGTALWTNIPAGTLRSNTTYDASIMFVRAAYVTNNAGYSTSAIRATVTQFPIVTLGTPLVFTNAVRNGGVFGFDVLCAMGQTFTILSSTNPALPAAQWSALLTTNSTVTRVHYSDPQSATNRALFYRARNGI